MIKIKKINNTQNNNYENKFRKLKVYFAYQSEKMCNQNGIASCWKRGNSQMYNNIENLPLPFKFVKDETVSKEEEN